MTKSNANPHENHQARISTLILNRNQNKIIDADEVQMIAYSIKPSVCEEVMIA